MLRAFLCSAAVLAFCVAGASADDKNKDEKDQTKGEKQKATIIKVDAKNSTITVKMKDKDGKEVEKKFRLTDEVRYFDSTGKAAAIDIFQLGNQVLVVEREGKLVEVHKDRSKNPERKPAGGK
jgi:uncharacterized protein YpmS